MHTEAFVEENVVACWGCKEHSHAYSVGSVFIDESDGVGRVAELLGHLATEVVADYACEVDVAEGYVAEVFLACHYHACHPEEDDVGTGYEVGGGVVVVYLVVAWIVDAVKE